MRQKLASVELGSPSFSLRRIKGFSPVTITRLGSATGILVSLFMFSRQTVPFEEPPDKDHVVRDGGPLQRRAPEPIEERQHGSIISRRLGRHIGRLGLHRRRLCPQRSAFAGRPPRLYRRHGLVPRRPGSRL